MWGAFESLGQFLKPTDNARQPKFKLSPEDPPEITSKRTARVPNFKEGVALDMQLQKANDKIADYLVASLSKGDSLEIALSKVAADTVAAKGLALVCPPLAVLYASGKIAHGVSEGISRFGASREVRSRVKEMERDDGASASSLVNRKDGAYTAGSASDLVGDAIDGSIFSIATTSADLSDHAKHVWSAIDSVGDGLTGVKAGVEVFRSAFRSNLNEDEIGKYVKILRQIKPNCSDKKKDYD